MPPSSPRPAKPWDEAALRAMEREALAEGHPWVAGLDEAGRGPLAGPVVAACVVPPPGALGGWAGLTDSKAMSPAARAAMVPKIEALAWAHGLGWATAAEVDAINVLQASLLAMQRALEAACRQAQEAGRPLPGLCPGEWAKAGMLLVDGNRPLGAWVGAQRTVVKGDAKVLIISAASVLAKEARDAHMADLDRRHPGYGFAQHKGYGTPAHWHALQGLGPCPEHRQSFLKRLHRPS